jgi:isopentenyldiphosphate isomerase
MGGIDVANGVVGAVLGMLFAVLFQQPLQNAWYRMRTRSTSAVRSLRRREASGPVWRSFSMGPLHTSALIVEGDGETSIPAHAVSIQVLDEEVELPADMAGWRDEIEAESARLRAEGRTPLWNGPRYAVESFDVSRTALDEQPEVHLRLRPTDYYTFLAAQQLDRRLSDGTTPRTRFLDPDDPLRAPAFLHCSFAVNVAVVTADDMVVVSRRSDRVRMAPGVWNSSVNEGLSRHIDSSGRSAPDLHAVARRGAREELSIEPHEYTLDLLAFVLDVDKRHWSAHFYARLKDLSQEGLQARMSRGVADRWEHQTIDYVPFRPAAVAMYMLRADRIHRWAPLAPALFHLALVHVYGRTPVERAEAQAIRRL